MLKAYYAPIGIVGYVLLAAASLYAINRGVPKSLETMLSIVAAPFFVMFVPLYPALESLGLMSGEYFRLPSAIGLVVATATYAVIAYAAVRLLFR